MIAFFIENDKMNKIKHISHVGLYLFTDVFGKIKNCKSFILCDLHIF